MNNTATATAKETVRRPAPAAPSSAGRMTRRVGNTTYRVTLHFKENGKEDMNDKIKRLIKWAAKVEKVRNYDENPEKLPLSALLRLRNRLYCNCHK